MDYTMGLDIGIASIGWAVLRNYADQEPGKIEDLGVRVFKAAENPDPNKKPSLCAPRREARGMRRRLRRRRHRKERIKNLIEEVGILSRAEQDRLFEKSGFAKDVYTLRYEGLERCLTAEEWTRVLLHLAQRRGYRSNSTAEEAKDDEPDVKNKKNKKNDEQSAIKTALEANAKRMQENGYRTVGEMFCRDERFQMRGPDGKIWRKTRNSADDYAFTVRREWVEDEVKKLFAAQRKNGNPHADEALEQRYATILLSQRSYDEGPAEGSPFRRSDIRGLCLFERENGELRAFKACYTFEYFKLLQDLNHIRIMSMDGNRPLTEDERKKLISMAKASGEKKYTDVRKVLSLAPEERFNCIRYDVQPKSTKKKKNSEETASASAIQINKPIASKGEVKNPEDAKFKEMQSYHEIRKALDKVEKGLIEKLTVEQLDRISEILSLYRVDAKRTELLRECGLSDEMIEALLPLSFSKAGNLSIAAMRKLIPYLETGMRYDEACREVYGDHRRKASENRMSRLSFDRLRDEGALDGINNPVVLRAVSQTCKVVNAIIQKYGAPQAIRLELAREMSKNREERNDITLQNKANQEYNEEIIAEISEIKGGERVTGQDLVKFKLFREQNEICLYSGVKLESSRLFEPGYVDVDHIIPYSISFDDSYTNKVLVLSSENRQKGNRLPLEYMAGDQKRIDDFTTRVEVNIRNYRKRQKLLKKPQSEEQKEREKQEWMARSLNDTRYISTAVYRILNDYLAFAPSEKKEHVYAVNGAVTDYMRKRFGLVKNREDGDLHHAQDAVVIATTTKGMIQKISRYAQRRERGEKALGGYVDPETGELMTQEAFDEKYAPHFPEPWQEFRREVQMRMSPNPMAELAAHRLPMYDEDEEVKPIFVSRMPRHNVSGAAHEATIQSKSDQPGYFVEKVALKDLNLEKIKNYYNADSDRLLYEALKAQLIAFGGDGKKAFAEKFYKPKKDGTPGPLVRSVKIKKRSSHNVAVRGGIARNEDMVRVDLYHVDGEGYYMVPIYTADTVKKELPNKAAVQGASYENWKEMKEEDFLCSIYAGDLIGIKSEKKINFEKVSKLATGEPERGEKEWIGYYISADASDGRFKMTTHDRKYGKRFGIRNLLSIEKYEVDVLGNYHKVHLPEKRKAFH